MSNKDLTTVRADQPADTPTNSTIVWCEKNGNTRGFTLDEISLLIQGATVQQGLQDAHRGCLLRNDIGGSQTGALDWGVAVYDSDSFWSGASTSRIYPPSNATKIRFVINVVGLIGFTDAARFFLTKNGSATPEMGYPDENANGRTRINISSAVVEHTDGDYYEVTTDGTGIIDADSWVSCEIVEQVQSP